MPPKSRSTQHGDQSPPVDFTDREKARLEDENDEERAEAEKRMALASERNAEVAQHGIHDPKTQELLEGPELVDDEDDEESPEGALDAPRIAGPPPPEAQQRSLVAGTQQSDGGMAVQLLEDEEEIEQEFKIGRVNTDLESVTFGHGNTFNFERGKKYRMPRDLYDHLDERGYIFH